MGRVRWHQVVPLHLIGFWNFPSWTWLNWDPLFPLSTEQLVHSLNRKLIRALRHIAELSKNDCWKHGIKSINKNYLKVHIIILKFYQFHTNPYTAADALINFKKDHHLPSPPPFSNLQPFLKCPSLVTAMLLILPPR